MSEDVLRQRLAAILAADAAGYSRLMAADERATVAALDAARTVFRTQIEANQGRIVDMAGDSVLAVFELATSAVLAALAIQTDLNAAAHALPMERRMLYRIGVHTGEIIEKPDGTVYGDGVNVAARLEGLAKPGTVAVSDTVRSYVRGKISADFEDLGEQRVKNIAEPVRAFCLRATFEPATKAALAIGDIDLSLPDKPSIAVLPFTNMSGEPDQEYFTDGITADIITELSRFHSLFVIARNSSFAYKGKSPDVRKVGNELGVRYVLEGSVRKISERLRVTAQLVEASTGNHLWAEKYDRVLADIFAVQEEIGLSIVAAIAPEVRAAEQQNARRRPSEDLHAYDVALRASADAHEAIIKSDLPLREKALAQARKALEIDPCSLMALDVVAQQHVDNLYLYLQSGGKPATDPRWEEALAAATKLVELDPSGSAGYALMGALLTLVGRNIEALANVRRASELNPNDVNALQLLAYVELMDGDPPRALDHALQAIRRSPRDPIHYRTFAVCAAACFLLRDHSKALDYAVRGVAVAPNSTLARANYLVAAVGAGEIETAKAQFAALQRIAPEFVQNRLNGNIPYRLPQDGQRVLLAWRVAAGMEDPSAAEALR